MPTVTAADLLAAMGDEQFDPEFDLSGSVLADEFAEWLAEQDEE